MKIPINSNVEIPVLEIVRKRFLVITQIFLLSIMLFLGVFMLSSVKMVYGKPYTDIDVVTANNMITNGSFPYLVILDVRNQSEYDEGYLENAILIPLVELESRIDELAQYKDTEIVVYCRRGGRSAEASTILDSNNYTKVFNMLGGITAWESADYPVIPEFPSWIMLLSLIAATLAITVYKKRKTV